MRRAGMVAAAVAAGLLVPSRGRGGHDPRAQHDGHGRRRAGRRPPAGGVQGRPAGRPAQLRRRRHGRGDRRRQGRPRGHRHHPRPDASRRSSSSDGYSLGLGRQIFYSDYVDRRPDRRPGAASRTKHPHDAIGAFEDIAAAGAADPGTARFKTRNDNSGTNVAGADHVGHTTTIAKHAATNARHATRRRATCRAPSRPGVVPRAGRHALRPAPRTSTTPRPASAAGNGCYTMIDRGTYNRAVNDGTSSRTSRSSRRRTRPARAAARTC